MSIHRRSSEARQSTDVYRRPLPMQYNYGGRHFRSWSQRVWHPLVQPWLDTAGPVSGHPRLRGVMSGGLQTAIVVMRTP